METTFSNTNTEFVRFLTSSHEMLWGKCYDTARAEYLENPNLFEFVLKPGNGLQQFRSVDDSHAGVVIT